MERAQILASWQTDPDGARRPAPASPLPAGGSLMDVTATPAANVTPDPNAVAVEVWNVPGAWLDGLPQGDVLWREPMPAETA